MRLARSRFRFALTSVSTNPAIRHETQFGAAGTLPPDTADALDLYTAIQQQLGLKLQSTKAPVDVLVIDRVEKPSAN